MKEKLKERLKYIEEAIDNQNKSIEQLVANLNILYGGKQEVIYWIKNFEEESK